MTDTCACTRSSYCQKVLVALYGHLHQQPGHRKVAHSHLEDLVLAERDQE